MAEAKDKKPKTVKPKTVKKGDKVDRVLASKAAKALKRLVKLEQQNEKLTVTLSQLRVALESLTVE